MIRGLTVAVIVGVLAVAAGAPCNAANLLASPSLEVEGTYDSNIFAVQDNVVGDYLLRVTPRLALGLEMTSGTVEAAIGIDSIWYKDHHDFNDTTASKFGELSTPIPVRLSSSFSIAPFARYLDTFHPYRRSELRPAPTPGEPPMEIFLTPKTHQRFKTAGLRTTHAFSERFSMELGGSWESIEFPDREFGLVGSETWNGNASWIYRVTPLLTPGVYARARATDLDDGTDERAYTGGVRGSYTPSPGYLLDGRVGVTWMRTTVDAISAKEDELSPEAILTLTYTKVHFHGTLQASYIFEGGGVFGTPTKRGTVFAELGDHLTEKWRWDLAAYYQNATSTDSPNSIDIHVVDGTGTIGFDPSSWLGFYLSGNLHRQTSNGLIGEDIDRYRVLLGFMLHTTKRIQ